MADPRIATGPGGPAGEREMYVNYLPVPSRVRVFLRLGVPIVLSLVALVASGVAALMQHPGEGAWSEQEVTLDGYLHTEPWPVLWVEARGDESGVEPSGRPGRSVILVDFGKIGASGAVSRAGAGDARVRVHGTVIEREGRQILELAPRAGAIEVLARSGSSGLTGIANSGWTVWQGPTITLEGEIVDPKCYLGAMRPGVGEVHRACARVCIAGGIPPGLIAPDPAGGERFMLLLDEEGRSPGDAVLAFVGRPVRVTGRVERWNDLDVLRIDPATIALLE